MNELQELDSSPTPKISLLIGLTLVTKKHQLKNKKKGHNS